MALRSGFIGTDSISQPPLQVGRNIWLILIELLPQWESTSLMWSCWTSKFNIFNYCGSYPKPNIGHKTSACLPILSMKLCTQTLFSPGNTELVRWTVCHPGVAILLLKYCICNRVCYSAEFIIRVTLMTFLLVIDLWSACSNL